MKIFLTILSTVMLFSQTANVQIVHNSPYPTVDIYVDEALALESVPYRASTGLIGLPTSTTVGIAPAGGDVIASFPFTLEENGNYVVVASGIVGDEAHPFDLLASGLDTAAADNESFALKVMHGVTDAPAVDIYANGSLLVENLAYSDFAGYLQVPVGDYTLDITAHGASEAVASFSAPLTDLGGGSGIVYASGFLAPSETDSAFTLILTTPSGYVVELPAAETALAVEDTRAIPKEFSVKQNYPNPFNPTTVISYSLPTASNVEVTISDLSGKKIRTLVNDSRPAGSSNVQWNGTNDAGKLVSTGVYFYTVSTQNLFETRKMLFIK